MICVSVFWPPSTPCTARIPGRETGLIPAPPVGRTRQTETSLPPKLNPPRQLRPRLGHKPTPKQPMAPRAGGTARPGGRPAPQLLPDAVERFLLAENPAPFRPLEFGGPPAAPIGTEYRPQTRPDHAQNVCPTLFAVPKRQPQKREQQGAHIASWSILSGDAEGRAHRGNVHVPPDGASRPSPIRVWPEGATACTLAKRTHCRGCGVDRRHGCLGWEASCSKASRLDSACW